MTTFQRNRSRSQLASNRLLMLLMGVFGDGTFTSRDVSKWLGLDFLYVAKNLSRMADVPYRLLSASRIPRPCGGYENSYTISPRGWKKISYLQEHVTPLQKQVTGVSSRETWAIDYLVTGKGGLHDSDLNYGFQTFGKSAFPSFFPLQAPLDEVGLLLLRFDLESRCPREAVNLQKDSDRTIDRALYLQEKGLAPQDINIPFFVNNAYERGSSGSAIIISLLIRGASKLRNELASLKSNSSASNSYSGEKTMQAEVHTPSSILPASCQCSLSCERLVGTQKRYVQLLEAQESSHEIKLNEYLLLDNKLRLQNVGLKNHIECVNQALGSVTASLRKFEIFPFVLPVLSTVYNALAMIELWNLHALRTHPAISASGISSE